MRILGAFFIKEIRQLWRDPFLLKFMVIAPFFQLVILGFSLTLDVRHIPLLVCNQDRGVAGRTLVEGISHNDRFDMAGTSADLAGLELGIRSRRGKAALYIPPDFSRSLERSESAKVLVLLDAVDGNAALTAFGYLNRAGSPKGPETRFLFNPDLRNEAWMVPGIVVLIITIVSLLISSLTMVREKERGTLEHLSVTPVKKGAIVAGKMIPFFVYSFIELLLVLKLAELVFHLKPAGSLPALWLAIALYLFTTLGLGLFVSTVSATQQQALFLAWFFMIFLILLSGFFIPVDNMPGWLRGVTRLNPLRYMISITRSLWLKGSGIAELWPEYLSLALLGGCFAGGSVISFSRKSS